MNLTKLSFTQTVQLANGRRKYSEGQPSVVDGMSMLRGVGYGLGGAIAGGGIGALGGASLGALLGVLSRNPGGMASGASIGAGLGSGVGSLIGLVGGGTYGSVKDMLKDGESPSGEAYLGYMGGGIAGTALTSPMAGIGGPVLAPISARWAQKESRGWK